MASDLSRAVLIGLGVSRAVEAAKRGFPWPLQPWTKLGLNAVLAGSLAALTVDGWKSKVLVAFGGCGVATITHELEQTIRDFGDNQKSQLAARAGVRLIPENSG